MTTLSIHPIDYFRDHVDSTHITKKLLRLIMLIGLTFCLVGAFYSSLVSINRAERDLVSQTYLSAFPSEMSHMVVDPFVFAPSL